MTEVPAERVPELVLSRVWNEGWHSRELRTTDGRRVGLVYRGVWTHSNGPDFRDAMLEIDGRLVQGAVELHIRSSDWDTHGHHRDPDYDEVALHVVLDDDAVQPVCGPGGVPIPTVVIGPYLHGDIHDFSRSVVQAELGELGSRACLPTLADDRPDELHRVLRLEGWKRLHEKQLRLQQELLVRPPGEVLYRGILDSLGLTGNRQGMVEVAGVVPLVLAERIAVKRGRIGILSALLGVGGFLPISQAHEKLLDDDRLALETLEAEWAELAASYRLTPVAATVWNLNRVRPLNHPVRRLSSMASLLHLTATDGLLDSLLVLPVATGREWERWLSFAQPPIGQGRRRQIVVNTVAPFLAAYAEATGDSDLAERVSECWERLSGTIDDGVARRTLRQIVGDRRFPVRSALEVQGLHQIGRNGCAHLRCFECPIAALAVTFEPPLGIS